VAVLTSGETIFTKGSIAGGVPLNRDLGPNLIHGSWAHRSLSQRKRHLNLFIRFYTAHPTYRHTEHRGTISPASLHHVHAMQPKMFLNSEVNVCNSYACLARVYLH